MDFLAPWSAPEVLQSGKYSSASDVWAFGVTAWELLTNAACIPYWEHQEDEEMMMHVIGGGRLPKPADCPDALWKELQKCWEEDKTRRPSFVDLHSMLSLCAVEELD